MLTSQRQITQGIKFGQRPPSLQKSEEDEGSSDEEEVLRSPLKVVAQIEPEPPKTEPKVTAKLVLCTLLFSNSVIKVSGLCVSRLLLLLVMKTKMFTLVFTTHTFLLLQIDQIDANQWRLSNTQSLNTCFLMTHPIL